MAYKVLREDSFEHDYIQAVDYLAEQLHGPQAAKHFILSMRNAASVLQATPFVCAISTKGILADYEMREYFVDNYVIVYRIDEKEHQVKLHRLFHQLQQYDDEWYWKE